MLSMRWLSAALLGYVLHGCVGLDAVPAAPDTDRWVGRWMGVEGTYLDIRGAQGRYVVEIADLDGPQRFGGVASDGAITFERRGKSERLTATDGPGTGMKWLMGKTDCLVVAPGEGYCRD